MVIKALLALTNNPQPTKEPLSHCGSYKSANLGVHAWSGAARSSWSCGRPDCSHHRSNLSQSGLSVVYTELLDFGGDEIHSATARASLR